MGKRVLLFGPSGQVGTCLQRLENASLRFQRVGRAACDLTDSGAVREAVLRERPDAVVNAAAYTAVDKAEGDAATCEAVNAEAPSAMAKAARELGIPLIHYSTDYVFNGEKRGAYHEEDATSPLGVYGRTKLNGEERIAAAGGDYLVLRTSWVYSAAGHNFMRTMLRLGAERPELRVVSDQVGSPTAAHALAAATARILDSDGYKSGVYHMTAAGATSWFGFAGAIFAQAQMASRPKLTPIATAEYPTPAKRPANSVLSNEKFESAFGFRLPAWQESLHEVMQELGVAADVAPARG